MSLKFIAETEEKRVEQGGCTGGLDDEEWN